MLFFDLTQVAFWAGQEEENEFAEPGNHLKHQFVELTKVEFWACQDKKTILNDICNLNRGFIN